MANISSRERGRQAEELIAREYQRRGAEILARNYTIRGGEIDIIARHGGVTIFIEVKYRANDAYGNALEAVTPAKMRRICRTAQQYAFENDLFEQPLQFDVAAVDSHGIEIIENAFDFIADT